MQPVNASQIVGTIDRTIDQWTPESLRDVFLKHGCAVVRGAVPVDRLNRIRDLISECYKTATGIHVHDRDLLALTNGDVSGFELADTPLLQGFLSQVYSGQPWNRDSVTARRIRGVNADHDWQPPLELHLDSQFHGPRFTVNFWMPFHPCGVSAPSLQLVPLNYPETRRYVGFTGELKRENENCYFGYYEQGALDPDFLRTQFGEDCFFRPAMDPGDVIVSSNWVIHGSYRTEHMKNGRTSVEIRFIGQTLDIKAS